MSETPMDVRVGDRERRAVDERLLAAVGDGVLTLTEYDERSGLLWQARTRGELDALVADLPADGPAAALPVAVDGPVRSPWVLAVMSEDRFAGALAPGQDVRSCAVMGKAVVDLRREDLPPGTRVQAVSVMGEVEVQVPPGSVVHLSGLSVMGERKVTVAHGDGPVVHVAAVAVMGSVKITQGDGRVVPRRPGQAPPLPAQRATSVAVAARSRGSRLRRALAGAGGLLVPAAVLGGVLLAGPDSAAVFGSDVVQVRPGDDPVGVSTLFGSVQVVVPDDVRVETSGAVVFGSTECDEACRTSTGDVVEVRRLGAFGSIEIVTQGELDREAEEERLEDAEEERQDDED